MRADSQLLIATVFLAAAACAEVPDEGSTHQAVQSANRLSANRLSANRLSANRLSANRLSANRLSANRLTVNLQSVGNLLSTTEGRELFSFVVACALPDDLTLEATVAGTTFEFFGEIGLVPSWLFHPLDAEGKGWMSACLFAHVSAQDISVEISLRGTNPALAVGDNEVDFTVEEGAFYGNLFTPLDQPIEWIACGGRGQATNGDSGGLLKRDCAKPDPANPGFSLCGFILAGDCGRFFPSDDPTCEQFSERGQFYKRCHAAPIDDERHHGHAHHRHGDHRDDDRVFRQVITTYLVPN